MGFVYLVVLALVLAAIWGGLLRRPRQRIHAGPPEEPDFPVEQPELQDDITDVPNGTMPAVRSVAFTPDPDLATRGQPEVGEAPAERRPPVIFRADFEVGEELRAEDWSLLGDHDALPANYGEESITAVVRNPRSIYVYWELTGEGEQQLRAMLGEEAYQSSLPCLRLYDITANVVRTIDVTDQDDHWFIHGLEPLHVYLVSYGHRQADGTYYQLLLSSSVTTPPEGPDAREASLLYGRLAQWGDPGTSPSSPWR